MLPKNVVHKECKFIGNKIADTITKSNDDNIAKQEPVVEIITPPEKRKEILNKLRKVLKMEHYKISKLLNDSTVCKSGAKNR